MKRIIRIWWLPLGILVTFAILMVGWPRSKLVWFTSHAITDGKRSLHVRLLIPRGWELHPGEGGDYKDCALMRLEPVDNYAWLRDSIRRALHMDHEQSAGLSIIAGWHSEQEMPEEPLRAEVHNGVYMAFRTVRGPGFCWIEYRRSNKAEFDSTYKGILNSVKVEEVRE